MKLISSFIIMTICLLPLAVLGKDISCNADLPTGLPGAQLPAWFTKLSWFGASAGQVKNSVCRNKKILSDQDLENYFTSKYPTGDANADFKGFKLKNENPKMIENIKKLTMIPDKASGEICVWCKPRFEQKKYNISESCTSAVCVAKAAFGDKLGLRMLYLIDRYGFNSSSDVFVNSSPWTANELDHAIQTIGDLPSFMFPIDPNQKFTHYTRGVSERSGKEETIANASMEFLAGFDDMTSPDERSYVIVHEWGHNLSQDMKIDTSKEWLDLSGWVDKGGDWKSTKAHSLVSKYGATNPGEDFAESVATYRYNPKLLQALNPEKYNFIKEVVFQGVEYLDQKTCDEQNCYMNKILNDESNLTPAALDLKSYSECRNDFIKMLNTYKEEKKLGDCIQTMVSRQRMNSAIDQLPKMSFPDSVRKGMNLYNWDIDKLKLPANQLDKKQSELKEQFAVELSKSFRKSCLDKTRWTDRFSDTQIRCQNISDHSYKNASNINDVFSDNYLMLNNRYDYDSYMMRLCLKLDKKVLNSCGEDQDVLKEAMIDMFP